MQGWHAVVLAAGEGKRMRSALPKVLHRIAGRPMLARVIETARAAGAAQVHVVFGHGGDQVRQAFAEDTGLIWAEQREQLGTGHAVAQAMPAIADAARVVVLYADVPLISEPTLRALLARAGEGVGVLAETVVDPTGYGRLLCDAAGRLLRVVEEKDANPEQRAVRLINTGIMTAPAGALRRWLGALDNRNAQGEYYLTDVFAMAHAEGMPAEVQDCLYPGEAEGANDAWQLARLERAWQAREAQRLCQVGVRLADPVRIDVRGSVVAGRDVELDVDVILEGDVVLADGVRVGPFCRLKDCRIGPGTRIHAHCDIDGAVVGADGVIGPYARLRPGTRLADAVHVGNFVETKQTSMGQGSKANHLNYLGDAEIGAAVNIGAGSITCNYDGATKHLTRIEDRAFIGSNSSLVAPVRVGAGATIGAGSVITRDAPAEQLSLSRARQAVVPGWVRPRKPDGG